MIMQEKYRLDEVGSRIWELIDIGASVDSMVQVIRTEYALPDDIPPARVQTDIVALLLDLRSRGLLNLSASVPGS